MFNNRRTTTVPSVSRLFILFCLSFALPENVWSQTQGVEQWGMYEVSLTGPADGNPFLETELTASATNGTAVLKVNGFYDGDGVYRIRFMPSEQGNWQYETRSNRTELNGIRGAFVAKAPSGRNHGPVSVRNMFHFAYADGTPYFPFGTTCYAWTHQGPELEAETLKTLGAGPFNKIRMCVFPKNYRYSANEPPHFPFIGTPGQFDKERFNPAFFKHLELRIGELRDLGIEADLILLHPYDKGRWGFDRMTPIEDERYFRYVMARLSAFRNVWWSLANEYDFMEHKKEAEWDRLFQVIIENDPYQHLRSIHNGTRLYNQNHSWVTHASIQNGSAVADFGRAVLYRDVYQKPIVFDEAKYEGDIEERWGNLSAEEMVHRFWVGTIAGTYVGHGETYRHPENLIWWAKGGVLRGQSPDRISFLRKIVEAGPLSGINPIDKWQNERTGGRNGRYYLVYFGKDPVTEWKVEIPRKELTHIPGPLKAEIIDAWNMTITPIEGEFTLEPGSRYQFVCPNRPTITLPGKPFTALRLTSLETAQQKVVPGVKTGE